MNTTQHVFYGMAGQHKGKFKSPLIVYENTDDAKEFANNYTDLTKEPKVIQFKLENPRVVDLTTQEGKQTFENMIKSEGLENKDMIDFEKKYFDDVEPTIENLDTLALKKIIKLLSDKFDMIKGVSMLDDKLVTCFSVLNTHILQQTEIIEIDLEGNLFKVEFKK